MPLSFCLGRRLQMLCSTFSQRQMWPRTSCCHLLPKMSSVTCFFSLPFPCPPRGCCSCQPPPWLHLPWKSWCSQSYCGDRCWRERRISLMGWAGEDPMVTLWELEEQLRAQVSVNGDALKPLGGYWGLLTIWVRFHWFFLILKPFT